MKFQPKRFIVEVKRGTSRAAFSSPDPSSDRFSSAEAMLFGGSPKAEGPATRPKVEESAAPGRRILRSLVEPPEPVVEEPAPVRRGRKPGSKNKPKAGAVASPAASDAAAERPRRGRKPGSKNKPKAPVATAFPSQAPAGRNSVAEAMRSYGFTDDDAATGQDTLPPFEGRTEQAMPLPSPTAAEEAPREAGRPRLRDRSTILKRYVLDLEPRPGHPGALRARRRARAGR